ncbi:uncharacterized protein V6R79_001124 [Siganus canaliculatus]
MPCGHVEAECQQSSQSGHAAPQHSRETAVPEPLHHDLLPMSQSKQFPAATWQSCKGAPAERQQATTDQRQLFSQIDAVCSSYLSADLRSWASDVLRELCVLLLVQNSKEVKVRENSKRAELEGPGGIQSRGYFLYRIIAFESMARLFRGDKTVSNRFNFRLKQKDFSSDCLTVVT